MRGSSRSSYKHATATCQPHDDQDPLRAGQSQGPEQDYTVSVWNTTPPAEEHPVFIRLPERILKATDMRVDYEEDGQRQVSAKSGQAGAL